MTEKRIEIPALELRQMVVTIQGITPLITHRFGDKARQQLEAEQQGKAKVKKPPRDPEREFKDSLYTFAEANGVPARYGFPAVGIKKAMISAGYRFAGETMTELRGVLTIPGELLEIKGSEPTMRSDLVKLSGKTSSIAYRPEFSPWYIDVPLTYNAAMIGQDQVLNLIRLAGMGVGIGDWRVEKSGTFGQFQIGHVEEVG